ncbi:Flagellar motor protein MotB [Paraburkholderia sacchari]|uniref:OmpA family protein n=1 Tax=Paraburkholderia sacchari TaxID=159450 RepID=UPI0039A49D52
MKYTVMAIVLSAAIAGCASQATIDALQVQDPTVLENGLKASQSTEAGAATEAWVVAYPGSVSGALLKDEQRRLQALGARQQGYFGAKAQCWLNAAREEQAQHNQWGFVDEAVKQADQLIGALEGQGQVSADNPKLRTVSTVRPDLWQQLLAVKTSPDFPSCPKAQEVVACSEVALMHAGHEAWTRLFDASALRVAGVLQNAAALPGVLAACRHPKPAPYVPPKITLPTDTLFQFDRGDLAGMLPQGRESLATLAREIVGAGDVTAIRVEGYTDRLGSERYNERLSQQRADTVAGYLRENGVAGVAMSAFGRGKSNSLAQCNDRDREALIACLAPDRRVELSISRKSRTRSAEAQ